MAQRGWLGALTHLMPGWAGQRLGRLLEEEACEPRPEIQADGCALSRGKNVCVIERALDPSLLQPLDNPFPRITWPFIQQTLIVLWLGPVVLLRTSASLICPHGSQQEMSE